MTSVDSTLKKIKTEGAYRELKNYSILGKKISKNERELINLSSNDYLGFSQNIEFAKEFYEDLNVNNMLKEFRLSGTSSRLITGNNSIYKSLENEIATAYQKEACVFYNSGYHANTGILNAITTKGDLILSDKLNHASILDGIRLSKAEYIRYKHLDYTHLENILQKKRNLYNNVIIVSESVFSMDGDLVNLEKLIEIKQKYNCQIYLDEAHALGVFGKLGLGLSENENKISEIDYIVGTFGKALASQGGFLVCKNNIREMIINSSRSLIYTTALPPISLHWNRFIFRKSLDSGLQRKKLEDLRRFTLKEIEKNLGITTNSKSNIIPIIIGENQKCLELANHVEKNGFLCTPIRPPSVPHNTSRLRISLNTMIEKEDICKFVEAIKSF